MTGVQNMQEIRESDLGFFKRIGIDCKIKGLKLYYTFADKFIEKAYEFYINQLNGSYPKQMLNKEVILTLDQKIIRKFKPYILADIEDFFSYKREYAEIFLYHYYLYLNEFIDELQFVDVLLFGFQLIEDYVHNVYLNEIELKVKESTSKKLGIDSKDTVYLIKYAWQMKLYGLIWYTDKKFSPGVHSQIQNYILRPLRETGIFDKLFNITKHCVFSSKRNREAIWTFLSDVMAKDSDYVISELFYNVLYYILPIIHKSYNPIGFTVDFLNRQLHYIYSNIYYITITYLDIDDLYRANIDYSLKVAFDTVIQKMYDYISQNYTFPLHIIKETFKPNDMIFDFFVRPIVNLFYNQPITLKFQKNEQAILSIYISLLLQKYARLNVIPKILTGNPKLQVNRKVKLNSCKHLLEELYKHPNNPYKHWSYQNKFFTNLISKVTQYKWLDLLEQKLFYIRPETFAYEIKIYLDFLNKAQFICSQLKNENFDMRRLQV